jgi:hypothetical protein
MAQEVREALVAQLLLVQVELQTQEMVELVAQVVDLHQRVVALVVPVS